MTESEIHMPPLEVQEKINRETKFLTRGRKNVTSPGESQPCIGTASLHTCLGVAIYDREKKIGGGYHQYFDEIRSFSPFREWTWKLIDDAREAGGRKFALSIVNVGNLIYRTPQKNRELGSVVEETVKDVMSSGVITGIVYIDSEEFRLDTRTGQVFQLYYFPFVAANLSKL